MAKQNLSLRHVRRNCLDCCGDDRKCITWCPCDGLHATRCEMWPFRFGVQPATFRAKWGDRLLTPEMMPPSNIDVAKLPGTLEVAALGEIDVDGYRQPAVEKPELMSTLSPEERDRRAERMRRLRHRAHKSAKETSATASGSA